MNKDDVLKSTFVHKASEIPDNSFAATKSFSATYEATGEYTDSSHSDLG